MPHLYDVAAIGNAIVDVIAPADDAFLTDNKLDKGAMMLVDAEQSAALYAKMAAGVETSGGSAGNTIAGVASFGGKAAYLGKVADDQLGKVFAHDMRAIGAHFATPPLVDGKATAVSMINVTPDGQRTMCTFLGASVEFTDADVDKDVIEGAKIVYLEGYLFDAEAARRAFAKAAALAHGSGRMIALTLSDGFVVERHRDGLMGFIESQVDLLFANETELKALFRTDDFNQALHALRPHVKIAAVTRGEKGSVVIDHGERLTVDAAPVDKVVDTTGAGDQYAAGFMFGLSRGRSLQRCGQLASLAAAEVISHYGPRPLVSLKDLAASKGTETMARTAEVVRNTKETEIRIVLDLDGTGESKVSTGIGFYDHMLESFIRHGGFDATIETKGDLHIDMHHTVEDTGIVLGQAFNRALDGFKGVRRFGHAYIPMDETLTRCAIDLSNRPYLIHNVSYLTPKVGDMDTELFKEFHHAFAMNCGACVHLETLYGKNSHHIAESGFKALARALRHAVELDPKTGGHAPSTKGVL